jgi:hypothetical protein
MRATCPTHLNILGAPHYAVFSTLLSLHPYYVPICPQHPVLKHPQSVFFLEHERLDFTLIQNSRQNNVSLYFYPCVVSRQDETGPYITLNKSGKRIK